jgi:hypothetical protein
MAVALDTRVTPGIHPGSGWRFSWWLAAAALVLAPGLLTALLLHASLGATIFDCCPVANDEIGYWLEINAFRAAGFGGGYFSGNEQMAPARFCHFDSHGPGYPVLYGLMARVLGWQLWSGPVFHLLCMAVATTVWLATCRPDCKRLTTTILLFATFWPCLLLLPSAMQEGLHFALAILLGAIVERWIATPRLRVTEIALAAVVIAACAIVRLSWAFLLLPWLVLAVKGVPLRSRAIAAAAAGGLGVALLLLSHWLNAPYPWSFVSSLARESGESPGKAGAVFTEHAIWNLRNFTLFRVGKPLEMLQRGTLIVVLALVPLMLWRARRSGGGDAWRRWLFTVLNLAPLVIAAILVYDVGLWRDYRVLAPHLLLSLLVLAGPSTQRWVLGLCGVHLLFLPAFLGQYAATNTERVKWDRALIASFRRHTNEVLRFEPGRDPWENTILVSNKCFAFPLAAVPPGIGVSEVLSWPELGDPPRSRYLLMTEEETGALQRRLHLQPLARTPLGLLSIKSREVSGKDGD